MSLNVTTTTGLSAIDLSSMDIETALMAVQTQRATLLEDQLKDQMKAVQARNKLIETMNTLLAGVRDARPGGEATTEADIPYEGNDVQVPVDDYIRRELEYIDELTVQENALVSQLGNQTGDELEATNDALTTVRRNLQSARENVEEAQAADPDSTVGVNLSWALGIYGFTSGKLEQQEFDQLINNITSRIDGLNSSQQMDMLRLQSVTNKRNEAFDIMTNFIKKMQDSRSSIVGNMR